MVLISRGMGIYYLSFLLYAKLSDEASYFLFLRSAFFFVVLLLQTQNLFHGFGFMHSSFNLMHN